MVRHEAAEALGGIATPEVLPYLKEYMTREDAPIALDMYEVIRKFQYASGLDTTQMTEAVDA
ncbi:hypothetical protein BGW80DRAFT_1274846 [Lactifluus volemus]|nr:hypothetical protein BGW80DRAFT_1274846 [Lactifluus volemus]